MDGTDRPVASLIAGYRTMQNAWVMEAEMLARLRDDVRDAADREKAEILAKTRQRIRDVVTNARREMLVLTEQVRASLGEGNEPPRVAPSAPMEALPPGEDPWADFRSLP